MSLFKAYCLFAVTKFLTQDHLVLVFYICTFWFSQNKNIRYVSYQYLLAAAFLYCFIGEKQPWHR